MSEPVPPAPPHRDDATVAVTDARSDADVLATLDRLEAESNRRRDELKRIAAQLPAAVSRRTMLRSLAADLRHAPNKTDIARRALLKLARAPRALWRRVGGQRRPA